MKVWINILVVLMCGSVFAENLNFDFSKINIKKPIKISPEVRKKVLLNDLSGYLLGGFHSKNDIKDFESIYNSLVELEKFPRRLDSVTKELKPKMKKGVLNLKFEIENKNKYIFRNLCEKLRSALGIKKHIYNLKRCIKTLSYLLVYNNAYDKCKKLVGKNFFKYGGKIRVDVDNKYLTQKFSTIVTSDKGCKNIPYKIQEIIKNTKDIFK